MFYKIRNFNKFDKRELLDVQDYILVDDYYKKIKQREDQIRENEKNGYRIADNEFRNSLIFNKNILIFHSAENALKKFNWNKYVPQRPEFTTLTKSDKD